MPKRIFAKSELCTGCALCASACSVTKFGVCTPRKSGITILRNPFERYELQLICRQCDEPYCVQACISGALQKDADTGVVHRDPDRCVGCWSCVMSCPHGAIVPVAWEGKDHQISLKCDLCPGRETPACVAVCPTGALVYAEA